MQIKLIKTLILTSFILICFAGIGSATNYYVSNDGSNSNTGLSIDDAWATPSHAVSGTATASGVNAGDTIYLLNGIWLDEVVDFKVSGTSGNPITLTAYNGTPIIYTDDGHGAWGSNENGYFGIEIRGQKYINVSGITMGGYRADVWIGDSDNIHISNMDLGKYGPYDSMFAVMMYYDVHNSSLTDSICDKSYFNTVCVWGHIYDDKPSIPHATSHITIDGNTITNSSTHNLIDLNDFVYNITISNNKLSDKVYDTTGIWMHTYDEVYENISIINNDFQNCYRGIRPINTTNLRIIGNTFTDTGTAGDIRMYGIYGDNPDSVNQNVYVADNVFDRFVQTESIITGLFENNTIQSGEYYKFENSTDITVRNENGNNFEIRTDSNSDVVFEYTDGTVFEAERTGGTNYASPSDVRFYLDRSKIHMEGDSTLRYDFTVYDGLKLSPTTGYLYDVEVNKYDTSLPEGEILVDFTAESTDSENGVITVGNLQPKHYYNIKMDGVNFTSRQADSLGQIQFTNSVWSVHTFTVEETSTSGEDSGSNSGDVQINRAPVLNPIGAKTVDEMGTLRFIVSATDADDDTLTYSATGIPDDASFDSTSGVFIWMPVKGRAGTYTVTFEVTDGDLIDSQKVNIAVNSIPEVYDNRLKQSSPSSNLAESTYIDVGNIEGVGSYRDVIWFDLSDYNSTDIVDKATLSLFWYYEGATRSNDAVVEIYKPLDWDTDSVTWNSPWTNSGGDWRDRNDVSQGSMPYDSLTFSSTDSPDNRYYEFDVTELVQDYVSGNSKNNGFFIKARDENNDYIAFYSSDWGNANQRPVLNIDHRTSNGGISGGDGGIAINNAPVLSPIGSKTIAEMDKLTIDASATDPDGDILTYSTSDLPNGATINPVTGVFEWTPSIGQEGIYSVTFEVSDGYLSDSEIVTISVSKVAHVPTITSLHPLDNAVFEEGDVISISVDAYDEYCTDLSYIIKVDGVIHSTSANYNWVTDLSSEGTHIIEVIVSDGDKQAVAQCTITINEVVLSFDPMLYDTNLDGSLSKKEVYVAIDDYYSGQLTRKEINKVVYEYFKRG